MCTSRHSGDTHASATRCVVKFRLLTASHSHRTPLNDGPQAVQAVHIIRAEISTLMKGDGRDLPPHTGCVRNYPETVELLQEQYPDVFQAAWRQSDPNLKRETNPNTLGGQP